MIHEYSLSSEEGVALMCLAEALLRIPDDATRDALIRDKVSRGDWRAHLGPERTLFVNAATWGLMVTGKITSAIPEEGLARALGRLIARGGEPIVRTGVDIAMRMMGETFVCRPDHRRSAAQRRRLERRGFLYSYDMLGEAATTAEDAARYLKAYEDAIDAIGAAVGRARADRRAGHFDQALGAASALSAQPDRSRDGGAAAAAEVTRGCAPSATISASTSTPRNPTGSTSRSICSRRCASTRTLKGWDGIGFVVQAYGKRCVRVVDWLIDLAHRSGHRLMVRLVKGAYWDSEIKQAQVDGLERLSGVHPQGLLRRVVSGLRPRSCSRRAT